MFVRVLRNACDVLKEKPLSTILAMEGLSPVKMRYEAPAFSKS